MNKISTDIENKVPVNQSLYYSLNKLLKFMPDVRKYELEVQKTKEPKENIFSEEFIRKIQHDILGWDPKKY